MKKWTLILGIVVSLLSCEKTIELDTLQVPPQLVIEGLVTNAQGRSYVRLTQSQQFYDKGAPTPATGATVWIEDQNGIRVPFLEKEPGWYVPDSLFIGQVGHTYFLELTYKDKVYKAEEQMGPVSTIDSLTYRIAPDPGKENVDKGRIYEMLVFVKEPQDLTNYYLVKFYRNDEVLNFDDTEIFVFDDVSLGEEIASLPTPDYYALNDKGGVELHSISRSAFRYYSDLYAILQNDGGLYSGIPANAGNNFGGKALGYFQVSAMSSMELVIK